MVPCNSYKSLCFFLLVAYGVLQAEAGPSTTPKSIFASTIVANASTNNTGIKSTIATTYANPSMTHIRLSTTMAAYSSATHIRSSTTMSANANATSANANATSANANATSANANATSANASATHARPSATSINRNGSMTHTITNRTATHMATSSGTTSSHHSIIPTPSKSPGKGDDKDYNSMKKRMWAAASFAIIFAITTVVLGYLVYRQRKINRELEGDPSTSRLL